MLSSDGWPLNPTEPEYKSFRLSEEAIYYCTCSVRGGRPCNMTAHFVYQHIPVLTSLTTTTSRCGYTRPRCCTSGRFCLASARDKAPATWTHSSMGLGSVIEGVKSRSRRYQGFWTVHVIPDLAYMRTYEWIMYANHMLPFVIKQFRGALVINFHSQFDSLMRSALWWHRLG